MWRLEMKSRVKGQRQEAVEVVCPKCRQTQIVYFPKENMPVCQHCRVEMVLKEILTEGKYS